MQTTDQIVSEHLKASERMRKRLAKSPKRARRFLISVGALDAKGNGIVRDGK